MNTWMCRIFTSVLAVLVVIGSCGFVFAESSEPHLIYEQSVKEIDSASGGDVTFTISFAGNYHYTSATVGLDLSELIAAGVTVGTPECDMLDKNIWTCDILYFTNEPGKEEWDKPGAVVCSIEGSDFANDQPIFRVPVQIPAGTRAGTYRVYTISKMDLYNAPISDPNFINAKNLIPDSEQHKQVFTLTVKGTGGTGGGGGGGSSGGGGTTSQTVTTTYTLSYETNGGTSLDKETYNEGKVVSLYKEPEKENAEFTGWYSDAALKNKITEIKMDSDKTVYAGWKEEILNKEDHDAYLIGYQDGMFYPKRSITRAETAAMIFRLLKPEVVEKYLKTDCDFKDIVGNRWYKTYVSTLNNVGIIDGYKDNTFQPSRAITRAEFAVMMDRFFIAEEEISEDDKVFTDVSDSYWAKDAIYRCVNRSLIEGYEDGTFRPKQSITRAEAAAVMNRVLNRNPASKDALLSGMTQWPDNSNTNTWYYIDVQEASNSHEYVRNEDGTERWTALKNGSDWKQYQ